MRTKWLAAMLALLLLAPVAMGQRGYTRHNLQVKNELGLPVTDVTSIQVNATGTTSAQTIYQDELFVTSVTNPITTVSSGTTLTQTNGSCYWYGTDAYDVTIISTTYGTINYKGLSSSIGTVIFPTYWAASQSQTTTDAQSFTLGTDSDWVLVAGATADRMTMTPATDGAVLWVGNATRQADFKWWAGTGSTYANFSQTASEIDFVGLVTEWDDASYAKFGTDADWSIYSSTAKQLDIVPTVTDESPIVNLGADTTGADLKLFAATTGDYVLWDASNETLNFVDTGISLGDADAILFGDPAGTGDFSLSATTNVLSVAQVVSGTGEIYVGVDGKGLDTTFFGETASSYAKWDQDAATNGGLLVNNAVISIGDQIVADTGTIAVGADGAGIDVTFYGEEAGDYLKWDATGASKLILNGADSSGTLFSITGIDTTGNTDTMTIAHSGTGDGLQITCTEADSVALNLVAAASQTTSVLKVDGTTGSWLGATGVGMVNLTNDGALAHVNSSLLYIANTGVPQNDSRGSSLRIVDTGNAAAGTAGYAVYVSATDATVEAMYVDDGDVKVDEDVIVGGYVLNPATAGTKIMSGCPITIEFRPTTAETLAWAVPDGFDLIITDAWGYKIAANGSHADDDLQIQNNDGSAADIFTEEELNGVNDTLRFQFDGLIDTQNEIEDTSTLDCVANEGGSVDCIVVVVGYLKTAD